MANLVDTFLAVSDVNGLAKIGIRWYDDGSVRIKFEDTGPVFIDELYINQKEPVIRARPQSNA
jgi:hypothetical protein